MFLKYQAQALAYERGRILSSYTLALCNYVAFVKQEDTTNTLDFLTILCDLLSARPQVCTAAMEICPEFRDMGIEKIHSEWQRIINDPIEESLDHVKLYITSKKSIYTSLHLLHAAILLLSNWKNDDDENDELMDQYKEPENEAVMALANHLIVTQSNDNPTTGLAGATFPNGKPAIGIDQVSQK